MLKSTAAVLAAAMFVGDRTTASTSLAGVAAVSITNHHQHLEDMRASSSADMVEDDISYTESMMLPPQQ